MTLSKRLVLKLQNLTRQYCTTAAPLSQMDHNKFLNETSKRRRPSMLRVMTQVVSKMPPDTISFAVGVPNSDTFPFERINISLKDGSSLVLQGQDLSVALQYLPTRGYAPFVEWLKNFQDKTHGPQDWTKKSLMVTTGGQDGLSKVIEMCLKDGDTIIVQRPVYLAVNELVRPFVPNYIAIDQDHDGMRPDLLKQTLEQLVEENKPLPKIMYVNPIASNPSGVCLSDKRKEEIYNICCEYDILILEDDPYYFLYFGEEAPKSFLSLDHEGRVIRFDSFSKILSSGLRMGFITGPEEFLRPVELHLQVSTLHASALSQMTLFKLVESWGSNKMMRHFEYIRKFYKVKRDQMLNSVQKHLTGLAEWYTPTGGMFLWLRIKGIEDTYDLAMKCIDHGLVIVPGHPFMTIETDIKCPYIRLSYSLPSPEQMDEGCARLARIIRSELQKEVGRTL